MRRTVGPRAVPPPAAGIGWRAGTVRRHDPWIGPACCPRAAGRPRRVPSPATRRRRRRSRRDKVLITGVVIAAVVLLMVGSVYGYLQYRLGQIKSDERARRAPRWPTAPPTTCSSWDRTPGPATPGAAAKAFGSASLRWAASAATPSRSSTSIRRRARRGSCRSPRHLRGAVGHAGGARAWPRTTRSTPRSTTVPGPLIETIENTFGIPINHFVIIDFNGVIDLVNSLGGINLDFHYPVA